jgi:hypothetical protein
MNPKGVATDTYDGEKGLELIPLEKVEVILMCLPISRTTILKCPTDLAMLQFS